ncbi:MAG: TIGR03364 family FAD-dependent oxidoreductase [Phycisphaerales bacterium]
MSLGRRTDILVVGGGAVGVAHAIAAVRAGRTVRLIDRHHEARGASVRNFGMIWPIGQPVGPFHDLAVRSAMLWRQVAAEVGFRCDPCGSLVAAYAADEYAVLEEFLALSGSGATRRMVSADEAREMSPGLRPDGLLGGLFSTTELAVDPADCMRAMRAWLAVHPACDVRTGSAATRVTTGEVELVNGRVYEAEQIVVCTGSDFETLFDEEYAAMPLQRCKLQMLATVPQPDGWRLGPHLAAGLTLRWYPSFAGCPTLPALRERISREMPAYDRYGIHLLVSQRADGSIVIGDSHEYAERPDPFRTELIDELLLEYLGRRLNLPDPQIQSRWMGVYLQRTDKQPVMSHEPAPGVRIVNALGGSGMTLSMALADRTMQAVDGPGSERAMSGALGRSDAG